MEELKSALAIRKESFAGDSLRDCTVEDIEVPAGKVTST